MKRRGWGSLSAARQAVHGMMRGIDQLFAKLVLHFNSHFYRQAVFTTPCSECNDQAKPCEYGRFHHVRGDASFIGFVAVEFGVPSFGRLKENATESELH